MQQVTIACAVSLEQVEFVGIANSTDQPVRVVLPDIPSRRWHLAIDTAATPPGDILSRDRQRPLAGPSLEVRERSVAVLEARGSAT